MGLAREFRILRVLNQELVKRAGQLGTARWHVRQFVVLAEVPSGLTDEQLRTRLLALADNARRCGGEDR
jgi:hypothetical protein